MTRRTVTIQHAALVIALAMAYFVLKSAGINWWFGMPWSQPGPRDVSRSLAIHLPDSAHIVRWCSADCLLCSMFVAKLEIDRRDVPKFARSIHAKASTSDKLGLDTGRVKANSPGNWVPPRWFDVRNAGQFTSYSKWAKGWDSILILVRADNPKHAQVYIYAYED